MLSTQISTQSKACRSLTSSNLSTHPLKHYIRPLTSKTQRARNLKSIQTQSSSTILFTFSCVLQYGLDDLLDVDTNLLDALHDLLDFSDESNQASHQAPSRQYVREAKAMSATPADVKETPNAFIFVIDMPGLKPDQINVQVEDESVLVVSGERKREKERDQGVRYLRMERRLGKYLKKFVLPENAETDKISAECQDGVLTVVVEKKPPQEPKKRKSVEVRVVSQEPQGGLQLGQGSQSGFQGGEGAVQEPPQGDQQGNSH